MRVVIDTNILVSFAIRPNAAIGQFFELVLAHDVPLVSMETFTELLTVLRRDKFRKYVSWERSIDYIEWYGTISELVLVTRHVAACRDPKDDKFLSLAVSGRADCIVAGDADLLDMEAFDGIPILSPSDFIGRFG